MSNRQEVAKSIQLTEIIVRILYKNRTGTEGRQNKPAHLH